MKAHDPWGEGKSVPVGTISVYGGRSYKKIADTPGAGRKNWAYVSGDGSTSDAQVQPAQTAATPKLDAAKMALIAKIPGYVKWSHGQPSSKGTGAEVVLAKFKTGTPKLDISNALGAAGIDPPGFAVDAAGRVVAVIPTKALLDIPSPPPPKPAPTPPPTVGTPPPPIAPGVVALGAFMDKLGAIPGFVKVTVGPVTLPGIGGGPPKDTQGVHIKFQPGTNPQAIMGSLEALGLTAGIMRKDGAGRPTAVFSPLIFQKASGLPASTPTPTPATPKGPTAIPTVATGPSSKPDPLADPSPTPPIVKPALPGSVTTLKEALLIQSDYKLSQPSKEVVAGMRKAAAMVAPLGLPKGMAIEPVPLKVMTGGKSTMLGGYGTVGHPWGRKNPTFVKVRHHPLVLSTTLHEVGHYLDHQVLGSYTKSDTFGSEGWPEAKAFHEAVANSAAFKSLLGYPSPGYRKYTRSKVEVFARAFAQYILTQNAETDPEAKAELDLLRPTEPPTLAKPGTQWTEEDFKPIAQAMATLLKKAGFYQKPETP